MNPSARTAVAASLGYAAFALSTPVRAASSAQAWPEIDITAPLAPAVSATLMGIVRTRSDAPGPALAGGGLTVDGRTGPWTFTAGELWVTVRSASTGARQDIQLPLAAVTYTVVLPGLTLSDRSRAERLIGVAGEPWRYRNRLQAE